MTEVNRSRPFDEYRQVLRLRLTHGLSQAQLAERIGTAQPNISRLERATINPSLSFLQRVATALDAEIEIRFNPVKDNR